MSAWAASELQLLRENYADSRTDDIATALGRTLTTIYQMAARLGLLKSAAYLASPAACRLRRDSPNSVVHRFQKGQEAWNKGKHYAAGGRSAETRFKPGATTQTWRPVGTYSVDGDGLLKLKVKDDRDPPRKDWIYVHRQVWEAANGPIPCGHIVRFRDGRKTSDPALIVPDALELITRVENMRRNTYHRYGPEIARAIQLRGALSRQINKRAE